MVLSLPGLHSCFRAGDFFLQSPDERAALSSPAGRSVKAIALAVHCLAHEIKKGARGGGGGKKGGGGENRGCKNRDEEKLKEEGEKEQRTEMTDKEKR